jgi:hypothetical protein
MTELSEFSLDAPPGAAQRLRGKSQLFRKGAPVPLQLDGTVLRHQFHTTHGYLFITDHDCPFEEITHLTLCSSAFRLLSRRSLGGPYRSCVLGRIECLDHDRLLLDFGAQQRWVLSIRPWGIPYIRPRLKLEAIPVEKEE